MSDSRWKALLTLGWVLQRLGLVSHDAWDHFYDARELRARLADRSCHGQ